MPRETITTPGSGPGGLDIELVWSRGLYAQLGVVTKDGTPLKLWLETWEDDSYNSVWADLDVETVDRMLKVLRRVKRQLAAEPNRARDESYTPLP